MEMDIDSSGAACVWIGEFGIRPSPREGMIWIEHESGEGMEVREDLLVNWLRYFYDEHF